MEVNQIDRSQRISIASYITLNVSNLWDEYTSHFRENRFWIFFRIFPSKFPLYRTMIYTKCINHTYTKEISKTLKEISEKYSKSIFSKMKRILISQIGHVQSDVWSYRNPLRTVNLVNLRFHTDSYPISAIPSKNPPPSDHFGHERGGVSWYPDPKILEIWTIFGPFSLWKSPFRGSKIAKIFRLRRALLPKIAFTRAPQAKILGFRLWKSLLEGPKSQNFQPAAGFTF